MRGEWKGFGSGRDGLQVVFDGCYDVGVGEPEDGSVEWMQVVGAGSIPRFRAEVSRAVDFNP